MDLDWLGITAHNKCSGQSYKRSMIVNYGSRVVLTALITMTLES